MKSAATKWRDWLELLMPVALVGCAWVAISAATSVYISWLDQVHSEILTENVATINAAAKMQYELWRLKVAFESTSTTGSAEAIANETTDFLAALAQAESSSIVAEEQTLIEDIRRLFADYRTEVEESFETERIRQTTDRAARLALEITSRCEDLRNLNQRLIERRTRDHQRWSRLVIGPRLLISVLGPLVGLWLGYRVAGRLQRRIAAIRVSLDGVSDELGTLLVASSPGDGHLEELDLQVRAVANRIHDVLAQLDMARREAVRNDRLAAVGQLAAGVAHELRNPLTAVKLLVQNTAHRSTTSGWNPQQLAVVQEEISRMEQTIQNLLDFARPASAQRVRHDLLATLRRAVNLVQGRATQDGINIEVIADEQPVEVMGDPEQLHQVFVNLLLNGMDAMPTGGTLQVKVQRPQTSLVPMEAVAVASPPAGPVDAAPIPGGCVCEVAVIDEGGGIAPELLEHIFEPFVTTKSRGTGLGLAISRRLVEEHGGMLTAVNRQGTGAEFTVTLPCAAS